MGVADGVIYDQRGWLTVDGPRFFAFLPLGNKARLENEIIFLAEAYKWDPLTIKKMTCSERHRYVKMKEAIAHEEKARRNNQTTNAMPAPAPPTGIDRRVEVPSVGINYSED